MSVRIGMFLLAGLLVAPLLVIPEAASAQSPRATPTPRVMVRDPFGVPAGKEETVLKIVAGGVKDARALTIRQADFASAAGSREEVKALLAGARNSLTKGAKLQAQRNLDDAIKAYQKSIEDYESVGCDVWRPGELAYAYVRLGMARWRRDVGSKKEAIDAFRTARTIDPRVDVSEPEFDSVEVAIFKKAAPGKPPLPNPPSKGFFDLARVMGLDGIVEVRAVKGVLSLRVHRILPNNVRSVKIASKGVGLDTASRNQLDAALGFEKPALVAVATPPPTPTPTATPTPAPTALAVAATPRPTPTPRPAAIAMATPPPRATPMPGPFSSWMTQTEGGSTPTPTPTPKPTPVVVAVATPAPTPAPASRVAATPRPTATPITVARADATPPRPSSTPAPRRGIRPSDLLIGNDSWASVVGGTDHRAAVYTGTTGYTEVPSGEGAAAQARIWLVMRKAWAVSASAGAMQRAYLIPGVAEEKVQSGMAEEGTLYVLRSDDEEGRWWIGGGASYVHEAGFESTGGVEAVPEVTRISPSIAGVAQYPLLQRLTVRARATAGVGLEMATGAEFGDGVGYDVGGEVSAVFAVTRRVRLVGGAGGRRLYTEFPDKKSSIEARRAAWLGIEAGF